MPAGYSFRPPVWALALAAAGCAAGIALGNWQSDRAAQKRAAGLVEQVALQGEFEPGYGVLLDNKIHRGTPGYHVVQPLRLADGKYVLVNRGWAPAGRTRDQLPEIRTPAGKVELSGVRLQRFAQSYEPTPGKPEGKVWQNVTLARHAAWSGLALEPYVIEQHSALDDGLLRDWPRADAGVETHESYALQWYSLAALSIILFFVLNIKNEKRNP
ncbi:MAG: SURF1 family protein [Betaproteobacteria bacterium]